MTTTVYHPDGHVLGIYTNSDAHDVAGRVFVSIGSRCNLIRADGHEYLWPPEESADAESAGEAKAIEKMTGAQLDSAFGHLDGYPSSAKVAEKKAWVEANKPADDE